MLEKGEDYQSLQPFEISDLGAMMSVMDILTTKGTREVFPDVVAILTLVFVFISSLGVMIPLIQISPSRLVLLGVISFWSRIIIVLGFSFLFIIIRLMG